jgi:hypothetical protein
VQSRRGRTSRQRASGARWARLPSSRMTRSSAILWMALF